MMKYIARLKFSNISCIRVELYKALDENIYKMSDARRNSLGIKSLPGSLEEALESLKSDLDYLKRCFHDESLETYIVLKYEELAKARGKSVAQELMLYYDV